MYGRDECVRLKNFVVGAEISENEISDCGLRDFVYGNSGKNGEGIYVGTSTTQVFLKKTKRKVPHPQDCLDFQCSRILSATSFVLYGFHTKRQTRFRIALDEMYTF